MRVAASRIFCSGPLSSSLSVLLASLCIHVSAAAQRYRTHLLLEDEAAAEGRALLRREVVEDATEDELGQQELVARADLARDAALVADDVVGRAELEPTQQALAVLELVEVHDAMRGGDATAEIGHLGLDDDLLGVGVVERGQARRLVQLVLGQLALKDLDALPP